jgi:hypothetical protein
MSKIEQRRDGGGSRVSPSPPLAGIYRWLRVLRSRLNRGEHHAVTSSLVGFKPHSDSVPHLSQMSGANGPDAYQALGIGFELRTFQGVNCDHVDKVASETNSMKWISSGRRAPV